jgi:hypothetical protein
MMHRSISCVLTLVALSVAACASKKADPADGATTDDNAGGASGRSARADAGSAAADDDDDTGSAGAAQAGSADAGAEVVPVTLEDIAGEWVADGTTAKFTGDCNLRMGSEVLFLIQRVDDSEGTVTDVASDGTLGARTTLDFGANTLGPASFPTSIAETDCIGVIDQTDEFVFANANIGFWRVERKYSLAGPGCDNTDCTGGVVAEMHRAEAGEFPSDLRESCAVRSLDLNGNLAVEVGSTLELTADVTPLSRAGCPNGVPDGTEVTFVLTDTGGTGSQLASTVVETKAGVATATIVAGGKEGEIDIEATARDDRGSIVRADSVTVHVHYEDLTLPELVTLESVEGNRLLRVEDRLYAVRLGGFSILDIATPESPTLLADVDVMGMDLRFAVTSTRAFALVDQNVFAYDVSDPSRVQESGRVALSSLYATALAASEDRLLVMGRGNGGAFDGQLVIVDLSDPTAPEVLERRPLEGCPHYQDDTPEVLPVANGVAYAVFDTGGCATLPSESAASWLDTGGLVRTGADLIPIGDQVVNIQYGTVSVFSSAPDTLPSTSPTPQRFVLPEVQSPSLVNGPFSRGDANAQLAFVAADYGCIMRLTDEDAPVVGRAYLGEDAVLNGTVLYGISSMGLTVYDVSDIE